MADAVIDKTDWLEQVNRMHANTALGFLGGRVVAVDENSIEIEMPITDKTRQPFGLLHGGVSLLLAESAASTHAIWDVDLAERQPVGIEINGSHLNSAQAGQVKAIGRVLNRTRRLVVHEVDVIHVESGRLLTRARVTNYYRRTPESGE